jgi:hypothetical protein
MFMFKVKASIAVACSVFFFTLISHTPVALIANKIDFLQKNQFIDFNQWQGSLAKGSVDLTYAPLTAQTLHWNVNFLALFLGQASADVSLKSKSINAEARLSYSLFSTLRISDLTGQIKGGLFMPLTKQYNTEVTGDIRFNQLAFSANLNKQQLSMASGALVYDGGTFRSAQLTRNQKYDIPKLLVQINDKEMAYIDVTDSTKTKLLQAKARYDVNNVELNVYKALGPVVRQTFNGTDPVMILNYPVFPESDESSVVRE